MNSRLQRALLVAVVIAPLLSPLLPGLFVRDARYLALVFIAIGVVWLIGSDAAPSRERSESFLCLAPNAPLLLWVGWVLLAFALASPLWLGGVGLAIRQTVRVVCFAGFFWSAVYLCRRRSDFRLAAEILLVGGLLAGAAVIGQWILTGGGETGVGYESAQYSAAHLALLAPVAAAFMRFGGLDRRSLLALLTSVVVLGAVLVSRERTGWIAGGVGLMAVALIGLVSSMRRGSDLRLTFVAGVLAIAGLGAVGSAALTSDRHIFARALDLTSPGQSKSGQWRLEMWEAAGQMIRRYPITGLGPGSMPLFVAEYHDFTAEGNRMGGMQIPRYPFVVTEGAGLGGDPHNEYLRTAVEQGIPGAVLFVAVLAACGLAMLRYLPAATSDTRARLITGCLGALSAQAVAMFFSPAWNGAELTSLSGMLLGLGMAAARLPDSQREGRGRIE